mmetsp:Transcript_34189/g.45195  ORF Transcript_34189/g.45195 Transcript_34189/m.45195 type:complete len:287 (+) Transcript_34189:23-883(+)
MPKLGLKLITIFLQLQFQFQFGNNILICKPFVSTRTIGGIFPNLNFCQHPAHFNLVLRAEKEAGQDDGDEIREISWDEVKAHYASFPESKKLEPNTGSPVLNEDGDLSSDFEIKKNKVPPNDQLISYTFEELRKYDGQVKDSIYVGLKGYVFDVSKAFEMYGKDGPYHLFAGHDASGNFAKMNFDEQELDKPDIDVEEHLNPIQKGSLDGWFDNFKNIKRYPIVGVIQREKGKEIIPLETNQIEQQRIGKINPIISYLLGFRKYVFRVLSKLTAKVLRLFFKFSLS